MGTQAKVEHVKTALNESPSEKEGKFFKRGGILPQSYAPLNESPSEKEGK